MDMFEEARGLRTMIKMCNMTQNEIAEKMGVSQSYVANKLRLLNFSDEAQKSIIDAKLTETAEKSGKTLEDFKKTVSEYQLEYVEREIIIEKLFDFLRTNNEIA